MHVTNDDSQPIAIIGMACRLPGHSTSPKAFWDFLTSGGCAENEPPASRFNFSGHFDGSRRPGTMRSPGGMFLEDIDPMDIDAQFFALTKQEAISMDPQQRQLLEVIYEGLENSGISLESLKDQPFGCFVGSYSSDYSDMQLRDPEDRTPSVTVGSGRAMLSNRISHFLDIKGPSMTIDTACSGSLVGVDLACRYLKTGDANGAIVAGCNLFMSPEHNMDESAMKAAGSISGRCHTFDSKADGYIKAEAINMVVLKRLDDALKDGDPIRAIIRGTSTNSDGRTPGIASPSSEAQASAIRRAYAKAGISDFGHTSYLECHGTGTQTGDPTEVAGVASVFSGGRVAGNELIIGSVKSNIGHSEPASGISGLLKTILALENGLIPGNPTFLDPNPKIDFQTLKVRVSRTTIQWPAVPFRRASVNSFGYGGSNAHVILDEPSGFIENHQENHTSSYKLDFDDFFRVEHNERPRLLLFSANDEPSLKAYTKTITRHLANPSVTIELQDLAYTLSERRTKHFHRAYSVNTNTHLVEDSFNYGKISSSVPKTGFVFTGQGAQWSQMGKALIEIFPVAREMIQYLDKVLQNLPDPPTWSLIDELTQVRSASHLRAPEFSQPLCTAIQLGIVAVLEDWGCRPQGVVGHSSGEIAAAVVAGHLTNESAIKTAYFRGKAAVNFQNDPKMGMLAVGLGRDAISVYVTSHPDIQIACVNSPKSLTLSGPLAQLESMTVKLQSDGHFARILQVDLAYHSEFMLPIAIDYKELLDAHLSPPPPKTTNAEVNIYSSVLGKQMDGSFDSTYWHENMVSPVLFEDALAEMIKDGVDILIEIGPSGSLKGPISQIKSSLGPQATNIEYCSAWERGTHAVNTLFNVAGRLFVSGGSVDITKVNDYSGKLSNSPLVIVDLPNYEWNHSTKYWHESDASKDWRFRKFPKHDLLGSKILGTPWHTPTWSKVLRVNDIPWIKDHMIGVEIVFPAAAYIAMAVEALYQMTISLGLVDDDYKVFQLSYKLRNVTFSRALVIDEKIPCKMSLSLTPCKGPKDLWYEFKISSSWENVWTTHCQGMIRLLQDSKSMTPKTIPEPLQHSTSARAWYKALGEVGYSFGPCFQKLLEVESVAGQRHSRVSVSFLEPESPNLLSPYTMHPVSIDACLQSATPSLWKGHRSSIDTALVPAVIDDLILPAYSDKPMIGIASSTSKYLGIGRPDIANSYKTNVKVYDASSGSLIFQMSGLTYTELNTHRAGDSASVYTYISWKPDISLLTPEQLNKFLAASYPSTDEHTPMGDARQLIDLVTHKKPGLSVMEVNMLGNSRSMWLETSSENMAYSVACQRYLYTCNAASVLSEAQDVHSQNTLTEFDICDIANRQYDAGSNKAMFDLLIMQMTQVPSSDLLVVVENAHNLIASTGYLLLSITSSPDFDLDLKYHASVFTILRDRGFHEVGVVRQCTIGKDSATSVYLYSVEERHDTSHLNTRPLVSLVHFSNSGDYVTELQQSLNKLGWEVAIFHCTAKDIPQSHVIVVDDVFSPVLSNASDEQWRSLQALLVSDRKILWITVGSQHKVTSPQSALFHGFARSARAEDPMLVLHTLDVQSTSIPEISHTVNRLLPCLQDVDRIVNRGENEYCEREGIFYISRVLPDNLLNKAEETSFLGITPVLKDFHTNPHTVRLHCERIGALDSMYFTEVAGDRDDLVGDCVEVEIYAAGLNYKDIAIVLGIVPANQFRLGHEGAGIIRRVGRSVSSHKVGDRVAMDIPGCFANRVQAPIEAIHKIPDTMTFVEAATMCTTFLTSIHALFGIANLKRGQTVLIHSASGGLGISAIQICKYVGAELFVTAGNDEKRSFLSETFGIPVDHIFSSRNRDFSTALMKITNNKGVDVILNSLVGDLLDETWRCIADRGIMIEIGKKDMLDRNTLSMEPFSRNASYCALDMSHPSIKSDRPLIAGLLSRLFKLHAEGHVKPISPVRVFPFGEIAEAFRYMRGASHIGKIVISNESASDMPILTRPLAPVLQLSPHAAYLIVGGFKGLCGSLAVYMARQGAKHLLVMSRTFDRQEPRTAAVLRDLQALGTNVNLAQGDVSKIDDVRRAFQQSSKPIVGIIHGAMVLRDKTVQSMTLKDICQAMAPKVQGTWNLHDAVKQSNFKLDFFTLLSSVSGVVGQKGQANYAAANAFLDAFSSYRHGMGLLACSVDLGVIEDIGYMNVHQELTERLDKQSWKGINEALLHKILKASILQQTSVLNISSATQMITGIPVPQQQDSELVLRDARFRSLCFGDMSMGTETQASSNNKAVQAFLAMLKAKVDKATILTEAIHLVNLQIMKYLGLTEQMEPGKPLSLYGLDSLVAVELRNWVRMQLGCEITTLDILGASTLHALCEKVVAKLT